MHTDHIRHSGVPSRKALLRNPSTVASVRLNLKAPTKRVQKYSYYGIGVPKAILGMVYMDPLGNASPQQSVRASGVRRRGVFISSSTDSSNDRAKSFRV